MRIQIRRRQTLALVDELGQALLYCGFAEPLEAAARRFFAHLAWRIQRVGIDVQVRSR